MTALSFPSPLQQSLWYTILLNVHTLYFGAQVSLFDRKVECPLDWYSNIKRVQSRL